MNKDECRHSDIMVEFGGEQVLCLDCNSVGYVEWLDEDKDSE